MEPNLEQSNFKDFLSEWILSPRVVFVILGVLLVVELYLGAKTLLSPIKKPQTTPLPQKLTQKATLTLSTELTNYLVGQEVLVKVILSTGSYQTDGTDVLIQFDPQVLEPADNFFEKGTLYQDYPGVRKDQLKGTVSASGITVSSGGFKGTGVFGTFKFKAKKVGKSLVELKFTPSSTTDSNIIESNSAKDLLEEGSKVEVKVE